MERAHVPDPRELREMLEQQRAITENLQRQLKVVCPRGSTARVGRSRASGSHSDRPARKLDARDASYTTSAEPPSGISSVAASRSGSRCR